MNVRLVGINHQTAPVDVREKAAIRPGKLGDALSRLRRYVPHAVIVSTCNRTEVYSTDGDGTGAVDFLQDLLDMSPEQRQQYVYTAAGKEAAGHLFRVACGLESMIIGEYEVLGQVGQAIEAAEDAGMVNLPLRQLLQSAIRVGRKVREDTGISKNAMSVSSVAVDLAAEVVGSLEDCQMLLIGAGEAGRLVAKAAKERGVPRLLVASRTLERASLLAEALGGTPINLSDLIDSIVENLSTCGIIVTCADAPHWILGVHQVTEAMRLRPERPLVIIDIAVPRNVEPAVKEIANVFLYNIDDLTRITHANRRQREGSVRNASDLITAAVDDFMAWQQVLEVRPVLSALMKRAEGIRRQQLAQTLKKLPPLSPEEQESLESMTRSIVAKILNEPVQFLKTKVGNNGHYAEVVSELFQLEADLER